MGMDQTTPETLSPCGSRPGAAPCVFTRRQALTCGVVGLADIALMADASSWLRDLLHLGNSGEAPAETFKGDAPSDEVFSLWKKRGWVHEGSHYLKLDRNVQCKVCPNNCLLSPGDRSHCRNKINRDGTLYTLAYANPCTFHVDPVEKKPLFHFLPGSLAFSLATSGCVSAASTARTGKSPRRNPRKPRIRAGPCCASARRFPPRSPRTT